MSEHSYRSEIDGLRAIAVVAVVLFHSGCGLSGGYVGVDVFFVISGFLITGIILRGIENNSFDLAHFWERRIRRIFPALFINVAVTLCAGYWLLMPRELEQLGKSALAQTLLLSNVYFWRDTGYFAGPAEYKPLLHTWSLAVEEQFYLFFPLLLVFFRTQSRKRLFWGLVCVSLVSLCASVYGTMFHSNATFFLLPTRAWELLAGSLLAVFPWEVRSSPGRDKTIAVAGLLAIVFPVLFYDSETPFPGLAALPPVLGTAGVLFAAASSKGSFVAWGLSLPPVAFIGRISYSLYLWHWPVIVFVRHYYGHFGWREAIFALACSLFFSVVSWKFIETPFRQNTLLKRRRSLLGATFFMSAAITAACTLLVVSKGLVDRFPNYDNLMEDTQYPGERFSSSLEEFRFEKLPLLGVDEPQGSKRPLDFIVWGDSHAMMLCDVMDQIACEQGLTGRVSAAGGQVPGPGLGYKYNNVEYTKNFMEWMKVHRPRNLVLINRWSSRTNGASHVESEFSLQDDCYLSDGEIDSESYEQASEVLRMSLHRLSLFCEKAGITLWIIRQVPEISEAWPASDMLLYTLGKRRSPPPEKGGSIHHHRLRQERVERIFTSMDSSSSRILDPAPFFFDEQGSVVICCNGRSYYYDNDHLTSYGASLLAPFFRDMFVHMRLQRERKGE